MKNLYKIIFLTFLSQFYSSQSLNKSKLDEYFQTLEKNSKFFGSIAVSRNGSVIYSNSVGYSDIDLKQKANDNTKYRIGSVSKTFTSVLVLKAVEQR